MQGWDELGRSGGSGQVLDLEFGKKISDILAGPRRIPAALGAPNGRAPKPDRKPSLEGPPGEASA